MKFFQKTSVAVLLTLLVVALCCVLGYTRAGAGHGQGVSAPPAQQAGESGMNYFLNWIDDGANLFTMETTDTMARDNLSLNSTYGCLLAVRTTYSLGGEDIETYAKNLFQEVELGSMDMLLVIDAGREAWYLAYGGSIRPYVEDETVSPALPTLVADNLDSDFFRGESNRGILALFADLESWCAAALPTLDSSGLPFLVGDKEQSLSLGSILRGVLFALLVNLWWIVLLLVILNVADRIRFRRYVTQTPPGGEGKAPFRPILFWHRQGSSWYWQMMDLLAQDEEDDDPRQGPAGGPDQGAGGSQQEDPAGSWQSQNQNPGGSANAWQSQNQNAGEHSSDWQSQGQGPGAGFHDETFGSGPNVGPNIGPDVGPTFSQGGFRQSSLWNSWRNCCNAGWSMVRTLQEQVRRMFGGRRM